MPLAGQKAEALGVEIYPGFAASEILYDEKGAVRGVATGDMGVSREGEMKGEFTRGMELRGRYTVFAEGARGHLTKQLIGKFGLDIGREPPKFGIGLKELWKVKKEKHQPGLVQHAFGWPLDRKTGGGAFLYHMEDEQVMVASWSTSTTRNPYLSPFDEFQRFKTHPFFRDTFEGAKRISYGARAITEGGFRACPSSPSPVAFGGLRCGFVNVPRIKGSHNAVTSGMLAADHLAAALSEGRGGDEVASFEGAWRHSAVGRDLHMVRNVKPLWSRFGTYVGIPLGALDMWTNTLGFSLFGTLGHGKTDAASLKPASEFKPIAYPSPMAC